MVMLAPNVRSIVDQDGAVILNSPRNQITTLDAMGGYIWRQLERGMTQEDLVRDLIQQTGEHAQLIEHDVREFLEELSSRHLLANAAHTERSPETL